MVFPLLADRSILIQIPVCSSVDTVVEQIVFFLFLNFAIHRFSKIRDVFLSGAVCSYTQLLYFRCVRTRLRH